MSRGTADDTINAALDALDQADFWAQAERATRATRALPADVLRRLEQQEAELHAVEELGENTGKRHGPTFRLGSGPGS